jgi:hypothetical protein
VINEFWYGAWQDQAFWLAIVSSTGHWSRLQRMHHDHSLDPWYSVAAVWRAWPRLATQPQQNITYFDAAAGGLESSLTIVCNSMNCGPFIGLRAVHRLLLVDLGRVRTRNGWLSQQPERRSQKRLLRRFANIEMVG